jgi:hypothetical protein
MLGRNEQAVPAALFQGFKKGRCSPEAIDQFRSTLITAYEQALQKGVSPSCALGAMLDLASAEFQRCLTE